MPRPLPPRRRFSLSFASSSSFHVLTRRVRRSRYWCPTRDELNGGPGADAGSDLARAQRSAGPGVEGRRGVSAARAEALEQLEQGVLRGPKRLPAQLPMSSLAAHQWCFEREVDPSRWCRLQPQAPGRRRSCTEKGSRHLDLPRIEELTETIGIEHRIRSDVEGPHGISQGGLRIRVADIEGMDRLEPQARHVRDDGDQAARDEGVREEGSRKEPPDLRCRIPLEDQSGAEANDGDRGR